jgi:uncharacterized membrane protein
MRATSSAIPYCILHAILELMKIKDLAELLDQKLGRNSLLLQIFPCGFFRMEYLPSLIAKKIKRQTIQMVCPG